MKAGFSLLELLCALALVFVMAILGWSATEKIGRKRREVECVGHLRQLGVGMALYAADHSGDWPTLGGLPVRRNTTSVVYYQGAWDALGRVHPYLLEKKLFLCPADSIYKSQQLKDWNAPGGDIWGSYDLRGFDQTYGEPMSRKLGASAHRALVSCFFMYAARTKDSRLGFHDGRYPVAFGDGHIGLIGLPTWIDPENPPNIWDDTSQQFRMWDWFESRR